MRDRGELPEVRHQPGMRIRRQAAARLQFAAEILQLLFGDAAFEKSARINAGRGVSLEINQVAIAVSVRAAEEVIERHFVQRGRRGISRNVPADAAPAILLARTTMASAFQRTRLLIRRSISWLPGNGGCCRDGNRVLVRSGGGKGKVDAGRAPGVQRELLQQPSGPLRAALATERNPANPATPGFRELPLRWSSASQPRLVFSINECCNLP